MIFECVPNVSEGRHPSRIAALVAAVEAGTAETSASLLDVSSDADHHRTVLTLAGTAEALLDRLSRLYEAAIDHIDLRHHTGVHPRIGAVDVVPFVPLDGATMADAVHLAQVLGARVAERFRLPVLLYGRAARQAAHRELAALRRGGLAGLSDRLATAGGAPDFGPCVLHPGSGATAIGARELLVAFNVALDSHDLALAQAIASRVRERGGGLPAVRALGLPLAGRKQVQVSMNLMDFRQTRPLDAFERVEQEAHERGIAVQDSEIVGLVPRAALGPGDAERMRLGRVRSLESCLAAAGLMPRDSARNGSAPPLERRDQTLR